MAEEQNVSNADNQQLNTAGVMPRFFDAKGREITDGCTMLLLTIHIVRQFGYEVI
jgi:hypothetical protein